MNNLMDLLAGRRTYRRFLPRPIPAEAVRDMEEAARLSSSARNRQALRFVWIDRQDRVRCIFDFTTWGAALPNGLGRPKEGELPVRFLAVVGDGGAWDQVDAGLAISNITLAAWNHGVGSCVLGAINRPAISMLLGLAAGETLLYLVAFGFPACESHLVPHGGSDAYWLDENRNYCVPRRPASSFFRSDIPGVMTGRLDDKLPSSVPPFLESALAWLREKASSATPGRHEIGKVGCAFANAETYTSHLPDSARFEVHHRYADIQFVLTGAEDVLLLPSDGLEIVKPFDEAKDIAFLRADPATARAVRLHAGEWMLIEPGIAHQPGVASDSQPSQVEKRVVKAEVLP